jgi:hypothetical protein
MRANQHVHAVDLVERESVGRAAEAALVDARRMCGAKALRRKRDPPRLRQRELFGQGRSARRAARA